MVSAIEERARALFDEGYTARQAYEKLVEDGNKTSLNSIEKCHVAWNKGFERYSDYQQHLAEKKGFKNRSDYQQHLAEQKGFKNRSEYLEDLARRKGFVSQSKYNEHLIWKKGFKNRSDYQKHLAEKNGFEDYTEYRKYLRDPEFMEAYRSPNPNWIDGNNPFVLMHRKMGGDKEAEDILSEFFNILEPREREDCASYVQRGVEILKCAEKLPPIEVVCSHAP